MASGSPTPNATTSHHQEGGTELSPGSDHPEHNKRRWVPQSYLLRTSKSYLALNQHSKHLSLQAPYVLPLHLPVSQHHNNCVPYILKRGGKGCISLVKTSRDHLFKSRKQTPWIPYGYRTLVQPAAQSKAGISLLPPHAPNWGLPF